MKLLYKHLFNVGFMASCLIAFSFASALPLSAYINQQYQQLLKSHQGLSLSINKYCQNPTSTAFSDTQKAFVATLHAWMQAQIIDAGPMKTQNLRWEFQFWPDKKNLIKRNVDTLLKQDTRITLKDVKQASVIAQGYSALEYALYELSWKDALHKHHCAYSQSVIAHLLERIKEITDHWSLNKHQEQLAVDPHKVDLVLNSAATHTELMHKKIALPLSKKNPYFVESWRSQQSFNNLTANLQALELLYLQVIKPWLLQNRQDPLKARQAGQLDTRIKDQFSDIYELLKQESSLYQLIQSKNTTTVVTLEKALKQLNRLFSEEIPQFLGVIIGFNANDGD